MKLIWRVRHVFRIIRSYDSSHVSRVIDSLPADVLCGSLVTHSFLSPPPSPTRDERTPKDVCGHATRHAHNAFLYISLPSLHDYSVKLPNFMFYGGRKQATTNFLSFSKIECCPQEHNSREIRWHLTLPADWNIHEQSLKKREFILKVTFSLPSPSPSLKLPSM